VHKVHVFRCRPLHRLSRSFAVGTVQFLYETRCKPAPEARYKAQRTVETV